MNCCNIIVKHVPEEHTYLVHFKWGMKGCVRLCDKEGIKNKIDEMWEEYKNEIMQ